MKRMSVALVICLMGIGCDTAKPPVAPPPIDMSKMGQHMAPPNGGVAAPVGEAKEPEKAAEEKPAGEKPAEEKPAEGEKAPAEEPQ